MPQAIPSDKAIASVEKWENFPANFDGTLSWPGGASGITAGYGYDVGYATASDVKADWGDVVPAATLTKMLACLGIKGTAARARLPLVRGVYVTQAAADHVFRERDLPRYAAMTVQAFPNADELSGDSFGALWATVMNRGAAMNDTAGYPGSRLEMRQIRDACGARRFDEVTGFLRSMTRLWVGQNLGGLITRYNETAELFEEGLADNAMVVQPSAPTPPHASQPAAPHESTAELSETDALNQDRIDHHPNGDEVMRAT